MSSVNGEQEPMAANLSGLRPALTGLCGEYPINFAAISVPRLDIGIHFRRLTFPRQIRKTRASEVDLVCSWSLKPLNTSREFYMGTGAASLPFNCSGFM